MDKTIIKVPDSVEEALCQISDEGIDTKGPCQCGGSTSPHHIGQCQRDQQGGVLPGDPDRAPGRDRIERISQSDFDSVSSGNVVGLRINSNRCIYWDI